MEVEEVDFKELAHIEELKRVRWELLTRVDQLTKVLLDSIDQRTVKCKDPDSPLLDLQMRMN